MTRLRPPPSHLPWRVLALCLLMALAMLWRDGGTPGESLSLIVAMLPLEPGGPGALRMLLGRAISSFFLISLALVIGLSFALALAMLVSRKGARATRSAGWLESLLTGVPPMAWALGAMVWLIRGCGLPVETLFPYPPPTELDTFALRLGRGLWSWLVPALALAAPVFAAVFFPLANRLRAMLDDPALGGLRARGLSRAQILHRHLGPQLRMHLARLARPVAAILPAFDIPVEELLEFDGWGRAAAAQLSSTAASGRALAMLLWMGGLMLAGILGWLSLLDRRGRLVETGEDSDSAPHRSVRSAICGAVLALALMLAPEWLASAAHWRGLEEARQAWMFEIGRALAVSLAALALVVAWDFLMALGQWRIPGRAWTTALTLAPVLAALLFWEKQNGRCWWAVALAVAIPGIAVFREAFRDADEGDYLEASRALGQGRMGVWWCHELPGMLPMLPRLALRNLGAALVIYAVLDFYSASTRPTWGRLTRLGADNILDEPVSALAPAALLAFWSLSFRLLGRAFHAEAPQTPTPPSNR